MNNDEFFIKYLKNEIYFCRLSLDKIDEVAKDTSIEPKNLFYHANILFNSLANMSKIINNTTNATTQARSKHLKDILKIKGKRISILDNRQYRNSNEHFDERIDELQTAVNDFTYIDNSIVNYLIASNIKNFGKIYVVSERTFYFINRDLYTEKICLTEIEKAVDYIEERLNSYKPD